MKVGRRGGFLRDDENFFGIHKQPNFVDEESDKARQLYHMVSKKGSIKTVTIYGELFGGNVHIIASQHRCKLS